MHQKALSTTATLEEEIEKLHRMKAHSSPEWRRMDRDSQRSEERRRKRWCQVSFSSWPTASRSADPDMPSGGTGSEGRDSDLGEPPQLMVEVASFLQGSSEMPEDEDEEMLPEPSISKSTEWVWWRAEKCDVPNWWAELSTVLQEDWPKRWELCFNSQGVCLSWTLGRPCSMCPWLQHVSTDRGSCPPSYLLLLAGTYRKFPGRRWLHTPKPCSASRSKVTFQRGTSHASWGKA